MAGNTEKNKTVSTLLLMVAVIVIALIGKKFNVGHDTKYFEDLKNKASIIISKVLKSDKKSTSKVELASDDIKVGVTDIVFAGVRNDDTEVKSEQPSKKQNQERENQDSSDTSNENSKNTRTIDSGGETKTVAIPVNKTQLDFIVSLKDLAIENFYEYNILPSITISQAILESDWGVSALSSKYHNYFGIKASKAWKGKVTVMTTGENYNDVIKAGFRAYDNLEESVKDHGKLLGKSPIYKDVPKKKTYQEQAQGLEDAGYATAKNSKGELIYADKLINVIKTYKLYLIDEAVTQN